MLVYATLFACAALMVLLVRRYDLYEREPWYMLLAAMALGALMMWGAGHVEDRLLEWLALPREEFATKAILVSLIEESGKLLVVVLIAVGFRRQFDDALDGIVYGTLGGLGMAIEESLAYLSLNPHNGAMTIGAEVVRLFAHALMGGLLGFAAGLVLRPPRGLDEQIRTRPKVALPATCVAVAVVVHFCWDYIAYHPHVEGAMRGILMLIMLCLMLAWGATVAHAMDLSRRFIRAKTA
jgi:RsiW-degrading membrane proteinase PrsW (M82 family)